MFVRMIQAKCMTELMDRHPVEIDRAAQRAAIRVPTVGSIEVRIGFLHDGSAKAPESNRQGVGSKRLTECGRGEKNRHLFVVLSRDNRRVRYSAKTNVSEVLVPNVQRILG